MFDRHEPDGEPHVLVEAELDEGVISSPLSKYRQAHSRICRPEGLASDHMKVLIRPLLSTSDATRIFGSVRENLMRSIFRLQTLKKSCGLLQYWN